MSAPCVTTTRLSFQMIFVCQTICNLSISCREVSRRAGCLRRWKYFLLLGLVENNGCWLWTKFAWCSLRIAGDGRRLNAIRSRLLRRATVRRSRVLACPMPMQSGSNHLSHRPAIRISLWTRTSIPKSLRMPEISCQMPERSSSRQSKQRSCSSRESRRRRRRRRSWPP